MTKKTGRTSQPAPVPSAHPNSTSIDDIFATGSSSKPTQSSSHPSSSTPTIRPRAHSPLPEAKKKKRPKAVPTFNPDLPSFTNPDYPSITKIKAEPKPRPAPKSQPVETIHDPSSLTTSVPAKPAQDARGPKRSRLALEEDEAFRDSRGDGPSEYLHPISLEATQTLEWWWSFLTG